MKIPESILESIQASLTAEAQKLGCEMLLSAWLTRFTYLTVTQQFERIKHDLVPKIISLANGSDHIAFVGTAIDGKLDGSSYFLHRLRLHFQQRKINEATISWIQNFNRWHRIPQNKRQPLVCLIDDFCGSGQTIVQRIETIRRSGKDQKLNLAVVCLAGMKHAFEKVKEVEKNVMFGVELKKGIDESAPSHSVHLERSAMINWSELLNSKLYRSKCFPYGYNEAQALYALEDQPNMPNSVFPIFWAERKDANYTPPFFREPDNEED